MPYLTGSIIPSVDRASYAVSRAKDFGIWKICYKHYVAAVKSVHVLHDGAVLYIFWSSGIIRLGLFLI